MTFLERNQVLLGLLTAALIVLGTAGALAVQGGMFRSGYEVTAEFADAAGLHVGDAVLVAGVRAGEVRDLVIEGDRVVATLFVEDHELSADTRAQIIIRTLVGKRAVELHTTEDWSRTLAEGDRIPLERTSLPTDVPEFGDVAEELLAETDAELLDTFLASLTETVRGQQAQVGALIEGGTRLTSVVNDQEDEVRELLRQLRDLAETFASRDEEIVAIIDDFGVVVSTLAERREDVRALLRETNRASNVAATLVEDQHGELDAILSELHEVTALLSQRQVQLAEGLAYSGDGVEGFASIALGAGGTELPWGDVFVTALGPAGVDVIAGCGGALDQALDDILGPDPRTCEEQEGATWPDDERERADEEEQGVPIPDLPGFGQVSPDGGAGGLDGVLGRALRGLDGGEVR